MLHEFMIQQTSFSYARAVGYRWLARWIFGYMGWDNTRPLPACIYHGLRTRFPSDTSTGYKNPLEREYLELIDERVVGKIPFEAIHHQGSALVDAPSTIFHISCIFLVAFILDELT